MVTEPISTEEKLDLVASMLAMREHFDARLDGIDGRLTRIESRLERLETKVERLELRVDRIDMKLTCSMRRSSSSARRLTKLVSFSTASVLNSTISRSECRRGHFGD